MINTSLLLTVLAVRLWLCRQGALNPQPSLIDENLLDWLIVPLGSTTDGFVTVRLDEVWLFEKSLDASSMTRERPNCGNTLMKQHSRLIVELKLSSHILRGKSRVVAPNNLQRWWNTNSILNPVMFTEFSDG